MTAELEDGVRIDKWLWAARFFKTRSQASQAVAGGRVHVNNSRIKPARIVRAGDELRISRGEVEFTVIVQAVSGRRGSAVAARELYQETGASAQAREEQSMQRRLAVLDGINPGRRPNKRERRQIVSFTRRQG